MHTLAAVCYAMLCSTLTPPPARTAVPSSTPASPKACQGAGWGGGEDKMIQMEGRSLAEGLSPEGRRSGGAREDAVRGGAPDEGIELGSS
jgi:hypothetical protein